MISTLLRLCWCLGTLGQWDNPTGFLRALTEIRHTKYSVQELVRKLWLCAGFELVLHTLLVNGVITPRVTDEENEGAGG